MDRSTERARLEVALDADGARTQRRLRADTRGWALLGLALASLAWATAFIFAKIALGGMSSPAIGVWRYALAALALAPFALRAGTPRGPAPGIEIGRSARRRAWVAVVAMSVFGGAIYQWLFLGALARTSATATSLLIALNPVMTILLATIFGERLESRRAGGAALAFLGAVTVISKGDLAVLAGLHFGTGDLMALLAAACWAIFNLCSRWAIGALAPSRVNVVVYGLGALLLAAAAPGTPLLGELLRATPGVLLSVAALGLICSALAGQLFLFGVRALGVGQAATFIYLVPPLTALLAALLLGERLGGGELLGAGAVLAGVAVATRAERSATPEPPG